jgi:hypothetical protein
MRTLYRKSSMISTQACADTLGASLAHGGPKEFFSMFNFRHYKYLPQLTLCAFALLPLTQSACTFKLGEPLRIYDSREDAKKSDAAASAAKLPAADTSGKSKKPGTSTCNFVKPGTVQFTQKGFPALQPLIDEIKLTEESTDISGGRLKEVLLTYSKDHLPKEVRQAFVEDILALSQEAVAPTPAVAASAPASRTSYSQAVLNASATTTAPATNPPAPSPGPSATASAAAHPFHKSIAAFTVFKAAQTYAAVNLGIVKLDEQAKFSKRFAKKSEPENFLAAYEAVHEFAMTNAKALGFDSTEKDVDLFIQKLLSASPQDPAGVLATYLQTYNEATQYYEKSAEAAKAAADLATCQAPVSSI